MSDDIDIGYNLDASGYVQGMAAIDAANQASSRSMLAVAASATGLRQTLTRLTPGGIKTLGMGSMVKEAADTESALSGLSAITKVTGADFGKLSGTMSDLARNFPIGSQGARDVVMQFTRMGVASAGSESRIAKLSETVVKLGGATGENINELAQGMTGLARATGNTGLDPKRFSDLGDSLTTISAQSGAGAGNILSFAKSIAPMAQAAGIGSTGVLGISSAFARLGEDGVGASTAVNKMLTDMNKAVQDGSPQLQAYSQILGMTTDQFSDFYKADPTKTLGALTTKIASSGPSGIRDLESIGIDGIRGQRAFQALIGSGGLEKATQDATAAYGNGSTEKASDEAFKGFNDQLTELTAASRQFGDALGAPLLTPLTLFAKGLTMGLGPLTKIAQSQVGQQVVGGVGVAGELLGILRTALPLLAIAGVGRMALTGGGLKSLFAGVSAGRGDYDTDRSRNTLLQRQGGRFTEQMVRNSAGIPMANRAAYATGQFLGEGAMFRSAYTEQRKRSDFYTRNQARYDAMPVVPRAGFTVEQEQQAAAQRDYTAKEAERAARRALPLHERIVEGGRTALAYGSGLTQSYFGTGSEFKRQAVLRAEERGRIAMLPGFTDQLSTGRVAYEDSRKAGGGVYESAKASVKSFHEEMQKTGKAGGMLRANFSALGESIKASGSLGGALARDTMRGGGKVLGGISAAVGGADKFLGAAGMGGLAGVGVMGAMGLVQAYMADSSNYKDKLAEAQNGSISALMDKYRESAGIATGPTTTFASTSGALSKNLVASTTSVQDAKTVTDADVAAAAGHKIVNQFYGGQDDVVSQLKLAHPQGMSPQEMQAIKQDLIAQHPGDTGFVSRVLSQIPGEAPAGVPGDVGKDAYAAMAGTDKLPDAGWLRAAAPNLQGFFGAGAPHFNQVSDQQSAAIENTRGGIEQRYTSQASNYDPQYAQQERLKAYNEAFRGAADMAAKTGNSDIFQELSDKTAQQLTGDTTMRGMNLDEYWAKGGPDGKVDVGAVLAENGASSSNAQQKAFSDAYYKLQQDRAKAGGDLAPVTQDSPLYGTIYGQSRTLAQSFNSRLGTPDSDAVAAAMLHPENHLQMNAGTNALNDAAVRAGRSLSQVALEAGNVASKLSPDTPAGQVAIAATQKADARFNASLMDMTPEQRAQAMRQQGMGMAATPRDNDFSNARADQGQAMVQQQYAADRARLVQRLEVQRSYDINLGRTNEDYTLQRGYATTDYDTTRSRAKQEFSIQSGRASDAYKLSTGYAEADYRTSTEHAEADFNTARLRQQRDFETNSRRSEEDYLTTRSHAIRDFNKQMKRSMEDAADSMLDPFQRIQTKATWDARNLVVNLKEQSDAMRKQETQLDDLRKKGLSSTAIEELGLSKSDNAQQVNNLAADALTDPSTIADLNRAAAQRRASGEALYQDPNNKDLNRQKEDFTTNLDDMAKEHTRQVRRNADDMKKVEGDQLADFRKNMDRTYEEYTKQMRRGYDAYTLQQRLSGEDLDRSLGHMADDQAKAMTRMDTAHQTSLNRMAEDLKNTDLTIAGNMKDLTTQVNRAMHGQAVNWQKLLVNDSQALVNDLNDKVLPQYQKIASQLGVSLTSTPGGASPSGSAGSSASADHTISGPSGVSGANRRLQLSNLADGGPVPGFSPHPKADNIPIMATAGEFMHPVSVVDHYGVDAMEALRQKRVPKEAVKGYASGGLISPVNAPAEFPWGHYPSGGWHPAIDYAVPAGTPVRAPESGTVVVSGWDTGGFGNHVRIRNADNTYVILGHLSQEIVRLGQHIQAGQLVGLSGWSGNVHPAGPRGAHLHEEFRTSLWDKSTAFDFTHGTSGYASKGNGVGTGMGFGTPSIDTKALFAGLDPKRGGLYGRLRDNLEQRFAEAHSAGAAAGAAAGSAAASSVMDQVSGDTGSHGSRASRNQDIARGLLGQYGFGAGQMTPLTELWNGESGWNELAKNGASGAYGIPQSLPGSKMASVASDWAANPTTQIKWGLGYIKSRYGSPSEAWRQWNARSPHWYDEGGYLQPGVTSAINGTGKKEAVLTSTQWRDISALAKVAGTVLTADDARGVHAAGGAHIVINNSGSVTYDQRNDFSGAQITVKSQDPDDMARKIEAKQVRQRLTQTRSVRRNNP